MTARAYGSRAIALRARVAVLGLPLAVAVGVRAGGRRVVMGARDERHGCSLGFKSTFCLKERPRAERSNKKLDALCEYGLNYIITI